MTDLPFSFPFYSLEDNEVRDLYALNNCSYFDQVSQLYFSPRCNVDQYSADINPDNFLSRERTSCGSEYYAEEQLLEILSKTESATSFNLVSYNIRSMRKNFEEFCDDILESLPTLSAIALQETWLSTED